MTRTSPIALRQGALFLGLLALAACSSSPAADGGATDSGGPFDVALDVQLVTDGGGLDISPDQPIDSDIADVAPDVAAPDAPEVAPQDVGAPDSGPPDVAPPWARRFGGSATAPPTSGVADVGSDVALDTGGNVYVSGSAVGTADFGGGPVTGVGAGDAFIASYTGAGTFRWVRRFGGAGMNDRAGVYGHKTDASGNVYASGGFQGTADFGGGPVTSAGSDDIFLVSFASDGTFRWARRTGGSGADFPGVVIVAPDGNLYTTGVFQGTVDLGGGPVTGAASRSFFVASYTSSGAFRWARTVASDGNNEGDVGADALGNIYVTSHFADTVDFGGGALTSAGLTDIFVASYTSAGVFRWARRFGGSGYEGGVSIKADADGNVYFTGSFTTPFDFGGGAVTSAGMNDIFLASSTSAGVFRWARHFGGAMSDASAYLSVRSDGTVYITGSFQASADFGGGAMTSAGGDDIFVASYTNAGTYRWARRYGSTLDDGGLSVAAAPSDRVFVTGYFRDTVDFNGTTLVSAGNSDGFLARVPPL